MVGAESPEDGTNAVVVQSGGSPAVIERKIDMAGLRDSISKVGFYESGLRDVRLGAQILYAWLTRRSWVLERAEDITIAVDGWTARSFTVDLEILQQERIPDKSEQFFLPLATLPFDVRDVVAKDENGPRASTLARIEQQQVVGSVLIAAAENILKRQLIGQIVIDLRSLASNGELDKFKAADPDSQERKDLSSTPDFNKLVQVLARREFVCLRHAGEPGARRRVCITYQEALKYREITRPKVTLRQSRLRHFLTQLRVGFRILSARLGWRPTVSDIELLDLDGAGRWQFDIMAPDGAELKRAKLTGESGNDSLAGPVDKRATLTHLSPSGDSASGHQSLEVAFRVSGQWRSWVLINAAIITLLLFVGAFRIGFVTGKGAQLGTRDLTAAFLLGISGAFAGLLARPTEDALASIALRGVRVAISILGLLAFTALASLAFGPSGHALFLLWFMLAIVAGGVYVIVLVGAGVVDRW
jgi:hypothetical protein